MPPRAALEAFGREHPGLWSALDAQRAARGREWPDYVWTTIDQAGLAVVAARRAAGEPLPRQTWDVVRTAVGASCFSAWRITQQVYRFDPALYAALTATPLTGALPGALFRRLPAWCVFLETPGLTTAASNGLARMQGVFAWLAPILVGADAAAVLPATVRPVRA